jgi:hypothetical protein
MLAITERLSPKNAKKKAKVEMAMVTRVERTNAALLIPSIHYWQLRLDQITPVDM